MIYVLEHIIQRLLGNSGILISVLTFFIQNLESEKDKDQLLKAIKNNHSDIEELKKMLVNVIEKLPALEAIESNPIYTVNEDVNLTIVDNGLKVYTQETQKESIPKFNKKDLLKILNSYDLFASNDKIIKPKLRETGIDPRKFGNKEIKIHFAITDNHFTELKNNELKVVEPFEEIWEYKIQYVLLNKINGKLFIRFDDNGYRINKIEVQKLPKSIYSKKLVVISINKNDSIETLFFIDNLEPIAKYEIKI